MSLSSGGRTWSGLCTTVTLMPRPIRFSAISSPMYPAPQTTTRFGFSSSTNLRMASVSSTVRMDMTRGSSMPGMSGRMALAPGERTSTSYGSSYSSPVTVLRTLTLLAARSIETTSLFTRASTSNLAPKDAGVWRVSFSLSVITPPT